VSDERVIEYLRFRGQAQPPTDLVRRVMAGVETAPVSPSPFAAFLPAAVAVSVVAVVAAIALILGQEPNVGPGPTNSTEPQPSPASVEELRVALESATGVLRDAPGVEGVTTAFIFDELGSASWFSWRPNGDQVVVNRSDVDVTETGWWLDADGGPPRRGTNISTTIQALVGSSYFFTRGDAGAEERWISGLREGSPEILGVPFPAALDGRMEPWQDAFALTLEGEASVRHLTDGGELWTLMRPVREGSLVQDFDIGPDGALRSVSHELVGVEPTLEERPITSALVQLTVLEDPEPIQAPDVDAPADPMFFGLPADFPLDPGAPAGDTDYREYIETALDVLEAYHWNTDDIDWGAARSAALDGLPDEPTAGEAHQRVQGAIQTFDTFNTVLLRPDEVPPRDGTSGDSTGPSGDRLGDVGYLDLPALVVGGPGDVLGYMRDGWTAMESIESTGPACGWIVDVRGTALGAYPPLFGVVGGLLGEGRVITFDSALGDWWVEVNDDGSLELGGEERTADILDSPAVAAATAEQERQNAEFVAMLSSAEPHLPADREAPVVVLTSNATAAAGEQLVVGFRGRPATIVMGGVTAGSPHGQMSLGMADGARLRFPVATLVDRDGVEYESNLSPDQNVPAIGGAAGDDPVIEAAVEWLEGQPGCS
jgi:carboxyl-terminal processing protease